MQDVKSACDGMEDNKKKDQQLRKQKWAAMSKHELVQASREIDRELAKRKCLWLVLHVHASCIDTS